MRLFEHPDFRAVVLETAAQTGMPEQLVEKDYYVTEVLRRITISHGTHVIFKGGTSLSKGWRLLRRFSEDLDLFLNPSSYDPALTRRGVDRELRGIRDSVMEHPSLGYDDERKNAIGGFGRDDYFLYKTIFDVIPGIPAEVKLEIGIQSGAFPSGVVWISSLAGDLLIERGQGGVAEDLLPFEMTLLHFRRTFVEKLFALHSKIERRKTEGEPIRRDARHYGDLYVLAGMREVHDMLASDEYAEIRADYDAKSREFFPRSHRPPDGLSFAKSDAIWLPGNLRAEVEKDYVDDCTRLFWDGSMPRFDAVLDRLQSIADRL